MVQFPKKIIMITYNQVSGKMIYNSKDIVKNVLYLWGNTHDELTVFKVDRLV